MPTEIERLYREHRARLVQLVERELHDHHDAEDVVQTAFIAAQGALDRGTIPRDPRAWLATIALNAARRLRRRRLNAEPLEEYAVQEASGMYEIRAALASLPKEQRAAVLYRDLLGLSYSETAEQMETSVNAVTMLLHRGRKRLRQSLGVTTGALAVWRWLRRAGMPQAAVAKGATVVVVAGGLATAGAGAAGTAARAHAPVRSDTSAAPAMRARRLPAAPVRAPGRAPPHGSTRRRTTTRGGLQESAVSAPAQAVNHDSTQAVSRDSRTPATSGLRVATIVVSTPHLPTLPVRIPATVTVVTPIASATVTTPTATTPIAVTATVTTPLTTVTLPVP